MKTCLDESASLKKQIDRLKECKDRDEVLAVEHEFSTDWDVFESLCLKASKRSNSLPGVVIEAVFHELTHTGCAPSRKETLGDIRSAAQDDHLSMDENGVSINYSDPKVSRYLEAVNAVGRFLDNIPDSAAFVEEYIEKYDHRPVFSSRKLWELHLGLQPYTKWESGS